MKKENIVYKSEETRDYYNSHRFKWDEFYESEKYIMHESFKMCNKPFTVLDVGCGCGGLGASLENKYLLQYYKGIDINEKSITWARENNKLYIAHDFECTDVLNMNTDKKYDFVVALGCMEVCIEIESVFKQCWQMVKRGGGMVISARLTDRETINDINKAYQKDNIEVANYVVLNISDFLRMIDALNPKPDLVKGYGYWCKPASNAVLEYRKFCGSTFLIRKPYGQSEDARIILELPYEILKN